MVQWSEYIYYIEEPVGSYFRKHEPHHFCIVVVTTKSFSFFKKCNFPFAT